MLGGMLGGIKKEGYQVDRQAVHVVFHSYAPMHVHPASRCTKALTSRRASADAAACESAVLPEMSVEQDETADP